MKLTRKRLFKAEQIKAIRPTEAPKLTGDAFLPEQAPYLKEFIRTALQISSHENRLIAWNRMLNNKLNGISFENKKELGLSEGLTVLFQLLTYSDAERHYKAFEEFSLNTLHYYDVL